MITASVMKELNGLKQKGLITRNDNDELDAKRNMILRLTRN